MVRKIHIDLQNTVLLNNPKIYISGPFSEEKLGNENNSFEIYETGAEVDDFVLYFNANESCCSADTLLEEQLYNGNCHFVLEDFYSKHNEQTFIEFSIEKGYDIYVYVFEDKYQENKNLSDDELKIKFLNIKD